MSDQSIELEIKLAHLEQALNEMSDVVYAQQASIDALELKCEALRQRVIMAESGGDTEQSDERPPHY